MNKPSPAAMRAAEEIADKLLPPKFKEELVQIVSTIIDREFAPAVEALRKISFAKADALDHSIDVGTIERAARIASAALARLEVR